MDKTFNKTEIEIHSILDNFYQEDSEMDEDDLIQLIKQEVCYTSRT